MNKSSITDKTPDPESDGDSAADASDAVEDASSHLKPKAPELLTKLQWLYLNRKKYWKLYLVAAVLLSTSTVFALFGVEIVAALKRAFTPSTVVRFEDSPQWCEGGRTVDFPSANLAVKLEMDKNYVDQKVQIYIDYIPDPNIKWTPDNWQALGKQKSVWLPIDTVSTVPLENLGDYRFTLTKAEFNSAKGNIDGIFVTVKAPNM